MMQLLLLCLVLTPTLVSLFLPHIFFSLQKKMDTYFGRWLVEDKHFKRLQPDSMCEDLDDVIDWVLTHDKDAKK
jgi:hypothetical protein